LTDENEVVKKKEQFGEVVLKKEIETLKNKITLVESSRDKKNEEIKNLKVKVSELENNAATSKSADADINGKYQACLKSLEEERRQKQRIQAELNGYKEE